MMNREKPKVGVASEQSISNMFDEILDELFANPLTPEEIEENRKRDPKAAKMVDEIKKILASKLPE